MNLYNLIEQARDNLRSNDYKYQEQVELVLGILRASGVVPSKRLITNGHLHRELSATIVEAFNNKESIQIPTRKRSTFHDEGISTQFITWLDNLVKQELLITESMNGIAEGKLFLGETIRRYMRPFSSE